MSRDDPEQNLSSILDFRKIGQKTVIIMTINMPHIFIFVSRWSYEIIVQRLLFLLISLHYKHSIR
jgi:hypothetical protein